MNSECKPTDPKKRVLMPTSRELKKEGYTNYWCLSPPIRMNDNLIRIY
jgi:hypothetical protein